jgi:signal transduction histidine kinase
MRRFQNRTKPGSSAPGRVSRKAVFRSAVRLSEPEESLRERIKELTCLYDIARLMVQSDLSSERIFQSIAELIPPAWQYPQLAAGRIVLDGQAYCTTGFVGHGRRQISEIWVNGEKRGHVEVIYTGPTPEHDEGPFLAEERKLLDAIAKQLATLVYRRETEQEKERLQKQLLHAERLATIGQLAAGVAHELNEPLSNILGFAQLAIKEGNLALQARADIDKIITASLHARDTIRKLLLFARQAPARKCPTDLNAVVSEGLDLFARRCEKEGIELVRSLSRALAPIYADAAQLTQVVVNLVVNAIQAMPQGGTLTISTSMSDSTVILVVEDTGIGMSEDTLNRIFVPFFTTKDVNEGTGLGLPVVHGILVSHAASIGVESKPGKGTRFTIRFPRKDLESAKDT